MQQLIASAVLQSSASVENSLGITSAQQQHLGFSASPQVSHRGFSQPQGAGHVIAHGDSQHLSGMQSTALWTNASQQTPDLSHEAPSQIPGTVTRSFQASTYSFAIPEMPAHTTGLSPRDGEGPSGMQLHLMHQLEGLERSVRRVEQQVSCTKQTRRRLKAASLPAQVLPFLFIQLFVYCLCIHVLFTYPFVHLSVCLSICSFMCSFIYSVSHDFVAELLPS
jgi:hypothetical protein